MGITEIIIIYSIILIIIAIVFYIVGRSVCKKKMITKLYKDNKINETTYLELLNKL